MNIPFLPIYNNCKARPLSTLISSAVSKGCAFSFSMGCIRLQIRITDISSIVVEHSKKIYLYPFNEKGQKYLSNFFYFLIIKPFGLSQGKSWMGKHLLNYTKGMWFQPGQEHRLQPSCPGTILSCKGEMI